MYRSKLDFIIQKLLECFLTIFFVTILSFVLMRLSPVDPAEAYVRRSMAAYSADEEYIHEVREKMGLNKPLYRQYMDWIGQVLGGDFGKSFVTGRDVLQELSRAAWITIKIVALSGLIQLIGIYFLGFILYLLGRSFWAKLIRFLCMVGLSIPPFFLAGLYMDVFAMKFDLVSVTGNEGMWEILPAALVLAVGCIAFFVPLLANMVQQEMGEEYAMYARYRGFSESRILYGYGMPQTLRSILPTFFQMLGLCLVGSAILERVFSIAGLGYVIIESVLYRDVPMIHAIVFFLGMTFAVLNILSEILAISLIRSRRSHL